MDFQCQLPPSPPPPRDRLHSYNHRCSVCRQSSEMPLHLFGREARVVCIRCWRWMFDVSTCWTCGELVCRKTDAVSFGWCWWHWSCFACLVCSAPLRPPPYLDERTGVPHEDRMFLQEPPLCRHCIDDPTSISKLEQNASFTDCSERRIVASSSDAAMLSKSMSLGDPYTKEDASVPESSSINIPGGPRCSPSWMSLLPSNRSHSSPSHHPSQQTRRAPRWMSLLPSNRNQHESSVDVPFVKESPALFDPSFTFELPLYTLDKHGRRLDSTSGLSSNSETSARTSPPTDRCRSSALSFACMWSGPKDAMASASAIPALRSGCASPRVPWVELTPCPLVQAEPGMSLNHRHSYAMPQRQNHTRSCQAGQRPDITLSTPTSAFALGKLINSQAKAPRIVAGRDSSSTEAPNEHAKTYTGKRGVRKKELSSFFSGINDKSTSSGGAMKKTDVGGEKLVRASMSGSSLVDRMNSGPRSLFCL